MRVYKDNGRAMGMEKVIITEVWQFLIDEVRKNIGCLVYYHILGIGELRLWDKEEE